MVASKIVAYDDPGVIDKVGHLIYLDGQNRGRGTGQRDSGQYDRTEEVLWPDGCACMYRAAMLAEIGGFDEDFFAYADDAELGLRARIAGWGCLYVPGAVVKHHRGATLGLTSPRRIELIERNRVLLVAKLFPWSLLWLNGAYYAARMAAGALASARNKGEARRFPGIRGKIMLISRLIKANLMAIPLLPKMFRKRAEIEKIRKLTPRQVKQLLIRYRIPLRELTEQAI
jgi:GT2 family glycosyltransferase